MNIKSNSIRKIRFIFIFIIATWCVFSFATEQLGNIPVKIQITNLPKITVEKPGGGWYDIIELENNKGIDTRIYNANIPIQVQIRNEVKFQVSLVDEFVLSNESNPLLNFTIESIGFGTNQNLAKELSLIPTSFENPALVGEESVGNYTLNISARQPEGKIDTIGGKYIGKLILLFEIEI
ncbi:TPA: hypothetical protein U2M59_003032 [Providencia stuartii]|nr:hypothetical protein [Providencia stuartii]